MTKDALEAALASLDTWIQVFAVLVAVGIVGEVGFGDGGTPETMATTTERDRQEEFHYVGRVCSLGRLGVQAGVNRHFTATDHGRQRGELNCGSAP